LLWSFFCNLIDTCSSDFSKMFCIHGFGVFETLQIVFVEVPMQSYRLVLSSANYDSSTVGCREMCQSHQVVQSEYCWLWMVLIGWEGWSIMVEFVLIYWRGIVVSCWIGVDTLR
jgi:hypothetical protein